MPQCGGSGQKHQYSQETKGGAEVSDSVLEHHRYLAQSDRAPLVTAKIEREGIEEEHRHYVSE